MGMSRPDEGEALAEDEAGKSGNAKWRARYRRRLKEERGLIQVNVTVPEGAAPLIKELARRLKDGTWPAFVLKPWDDSSRQTLAEYRESQRGRSESERKTAPRETERNGKQLSRDPGKDTVIGVESSQGADAGPMCPVTVRFAQEPDQDEIALVESAPFNLQRSGRSRLTWTGQLHRLVAQRLRMTLDHRLSDAKPVVTIHNPAAGPGPRTPA